MAQSILRRNTYIWFAGPARSMIHRNPGPSNLTRSQVSSAEMAPFVRVCGPVYHPSQNEVIEFGSDSPSLTVPAKSSRHPILPAYHPSACAPIHLLSPVYGIIRPTNICHPLKSSRHQISIAYHLSAWAPVRSS